MRTLAKNRHCVHSLIYHVILVVKYRRKVFSSEIQDFLKLTIEKISSNNSIEVIEIGCDKDHVHFLIKTQPTTLLTRYINTIKTISSREIRRNFPETKEKLWGKSFWSPSYFLATSGYVSIDTLEEYLRLQNET